MRHRLSIGLAVFPALMLVAGFPHIAAAQAPRTVSFQGRLADASGAPRPDGAYSLTFRLYAAPSGGTALWTESQPAVTVSKGVFSATLGSVTPFPMSLHFDVPYYLGVQVAGEVAEMAPRLPLQSVPYALALYGLHTEATASSPNVVAGYSGNNVKPGTVGAAIGGGGLLDNGTDRSNTADGNYSVVAGGVNNHASVGDSGHLSANYSTVSGGGDNWARADYATVAGGNVNYADGNDSFVAGGEFNAARGHDSFAAGHQAQANHDGTFVWADDQGINFESTGMNQFSVRATGGIRLVTGVDTSTGSPTASFVLNPGSDQGGHFLDTSTGAYLTQGGQWTNNSDRALKFAFAAVDPKRVLDRVAAMPITRWSYKVEGSGVRHIGPMAQDFAAAFHVGQDDRHIGTLDEGGVALAAIQGLVQELKQRDAEIARLKAESDARLGVLEQRLRRLERASGRRAPGR